MKPENTPSQEVESAEDMPAFMRFFPDRDGPVPDRFDWWRPERTGVMSLDVERGRQYLTQALELARITPKPRAVLYYILCGMNRIGAGDVERGFIYALTSKAVAGRMPAIMPDEQMLSLVQWDAAAAEAFRVGEAATLEYLDLARSERANHIIETFLIAGVDGKVIRGQTIALFQVIATAAATGAAN